MQFTQYPTQKLSNFNVYNSTQLLGKRNKSFDAQENEMNCCTYSLISAKKKIKKDNHSLSSVVVAQQGGQVVAHVNHQPLSFSQKYIKVSELEKSISDRVLNQISYVYDINNLSNLYVCKELKSAANYQFSYRQLKNEVQFLLAIQQIQKHYFYNIEKSDQQQQQKSSQQGIIKLVDFSLNELHPYIILEQGAQGQLMQEIIHNGKFSEELTRTYFVQLLDTIEFLFNCNIAHRDIKPENIVISEQFHLKLIDFGSAIIFNKQVQKRIKLCSSSQQQQTFGTINYLAPEAILQNESYCPQSAELFALGKVLFIMYVGLYPFLIANEKDSNYKLFIDKQFKTYWMRFDQTLNKPKNTQKVSQSTQQQSSSSNFSLEFRDLIQKMLAFDENERLTIKQIREHPWVKNQKILNDVELKFQFLQRHPKVSFDY